MRDINSLNKVLLIGHLGQNPEIRYIPQSDRPVARFSLATNERSFNPTTNESKDSTEWHRIVVWGKLAEFCEKYLTQGKQIYLEGNIRTRSWQDKEGNKRSTTEINARTITILGKRDTTSGETERAHVEPETEFPADEGHGSPDTGAGEDEVPF